MKGSDGIIGRISYCLAAVAACLCLLLSLSVTVNVIARYVFHNPFSAAMEINQYLFCAITMFATAFSLREDAHVRVDVFRVRMSLRSRRRIDALTAPLTVALSSILVWFSIDELRLAILFNKRSNTEVGIPLWIVWSIMVVGSTGFFLEALNQQLRLMRPPQKE
ncbi:TRAP transporter small permease subunit [Thermodesulforhabdus norvegica]|uniref:TRAP-type mannitol/chloroaromatic compound transport system, small permease component n=1 Tax=Thermodesulforhabdus norvegica TaxID=39841 RepID=A0A1I4W8W4_9BACT|nr:TRAP transporter small permease [Thermodesulforhabdus norvegica]SFN10121.1 TRAP-type mannitol/chloroaromatic compound transport system, small permease component [Thermodesulforhabdus norvegica]